MENHTTEAVARRNVQRYLRQLSYFEPEIPPPPIDGVSGADTTAALRAFQRLNGLPATGEADRETFTMLYAAYLASIEEHSLPEAVSLFPSLPEGYTLTQGNDTPIVRLVQFLLMEISAVFDAASVVSESGVYDSATAQAVSDLQYRSLLPVTGNMDKATWNALAHAYGDHLLYTDP